MSHSPPALSPLSRAFAGLVGRSADLSAAEAWGVGLAVLFLVAIADWATGHVSVLPLYLAAICFAGWTLRARSALIYTALAVAALTGNVRLLGATADGVTVGVAGETWNAVARFISFAMVTLLVGGLRSALELERWRAATDGLTGVLNKGAFEARMAETIAQARRRGAALVLAYMDLDGFKGVNDGHGHSAGDRVLTAFARAADDAIRRTDLFARIGGDEFVALLTVPNCNTGDEVAERLHHRLSGILRRTGFPVTCSMGALVLGADQVEQPSAMISLADALMYEVKRSGKNALRIARGDLLGEELRAAVRPENPQPVIEPGAQPKPAPAAERRMAA